MQGEEAPALLIILHSLNKGVKIVSLLKSVLADGVFKTRNKEEWRNHSCNNPLTEPSWALPETLEHLVHPSLELQLHQSQRPGRAALQG